MTLFTNILRSYLSILLLLLVGTARAQTTPAPVITSFTPATGPAYTEVVLTGSYFTGTTAVRFNGVNAASFTVLSDTQLRTLAPATVTAGPLTVVGPAGTTTSTATFLPPPEISLFTPSRGLPGSTFRATGKNFLQVSSVLLNQVPVAFTAVSATEIQLTVPATATTGRLQVTNPAGTRISPTAFAVLTAVQVTSTLPAANTQQAAAGGPLTMQFSAPITAASAGGLRLFGTASRGRASGTLSGGGSSTLTFGLAQPFLPGEQVSVSVPASLRTAAGVLATPQVFHFNVLAGGTGRGTFTAGTAISGASNMLAAPHVLTGDVDGDGDLDLLHWGPTTQVHLYRNLGQGTFPSPEYLSAPAHAEDVALGDVDGDGDLDMVLANSDGASGYLPVCLNDGAGHFAFDHYVAAQGTTSRVVLDDLDADGDLDLVAARNTSGSGTFDVLIRFNDGTGNFSGTDQLPISAVTGLTLGDVDQDGDLDLLLTQASTAPNYLGVATILLNDSQGSFALSNQYLVGSDPVRPQLADLDGDGDLDLVTANKGRASSGGGASGFSMRLNDGTGRFAAAPDTFTGDLVLDAGLGDVDGDGDLDLLLSTRTYATNIDQTELFLNDGRGHFRATTPTRGAYLSTSLALGDMDGDGDLDLVLGGFANTANQPLLTQVLFNQPLAPLATAASRAAGTFALFPNPAHHACTVELPAAFQGQAVELTLHNNLGQVVLRKQSTGPSLYLDATSLSAGLYEVHLRSRDQWLSQRLILE